MAAIDWADVVAVAPTATDVDALAQTLILDYVNITLAVARFDGEDGPTTKIARVYLAAHHATTIQQLCNAGAVTSDKAGDLARAYANNIDSQASVLLQGTAFGKAYLSVVRQTVIGIEVI
jgi:hypothetical protein